MPKVLNVRQASDDKPSLYRAAEQVGNPFVIGRDGTRDEVIAQYRDWIVRQEHLMSALELSGKNLVCLCAPAPCHGDVLHELANHYACDAL